LIGFILPNDRGSPIKMMNEIALKTDLNETVTEFNSFLNGKKHTYYKASKG
jgi:hypothetical protein